MDIDAFWGLVEQARSEAPDDNYGQSDLLTTKLSQLDAAEIVAFEEIFRKFHRAAYRADLWGAAFIIGGGCSDDGFDYFRAGLIALGRKAYENALVQPDSLADFADKEIELEEMLYVASKAYELRTGSDELFSLVPETPFPELVGDNESWSTAGDLDEEKAAPIYPRLLAAHWQ